MSIGAENHETGNPGDQNPEHQELTIDRLLDLAFGHDPAFAGLAPGLRGDDSRRSPIRDVNRGKGVFSQVVQVELSWRELPADGERPASVVVKTPAPGPNGAAAVASGSCRREARAYRSLIPGSPVRTPHCHLVDEDDDGAASFVLEDLGDLRAVDQLDGLDHDDALAVAAALSRFHHHWRSTSRLDGVDVRRATPAGIPPAALDAGLGTLRTRWGHILDGPHLAVFEALVNQRDRLVAAFGATGTPTLCHGDPRADNLVFAPDRAPVLFDWQQVAIQFGAADVAWLAATSLTPNERRRTERELLAESATPIDHYRLGLVLPGLAVLLLAQRATPEERSEKFVATTIERIAVALVDLDVPRW